MTKIQKRTAPSGNTFDLRFEELKMFKEKFGTTFVSRTNKEYSTLYHWTHHIKRRAKLT